MEFSPSNHIVQLCLQGLEKDQPAAASAVFMQAWQEAHSAFEKFMAAFFIARQHVAVSDRSYWFETALHWAAKMDAEHSHDVYPTLFTHIGQCYQQLNDSSNADKNFAWAAAFKDIPSVKGPFYHGTKAALQTGDLLTAGYGSNYREALTMNHIYFTALLNGAGLAAALAKGEGPEHVYIVEPTGHFENDPNVTDKKFPGNPTRSYRTLHPLKIVGEVSDWSRLSPDEIKKWREKLSVNKGNIIN